MLIDPQPADDDGVDDWYAEQREHWGYLPNYAAAFASRPDVARAWTVLGATVREGMDRRRFELARRRRPGVALDVLHRRPLDVPARRLQRRGDDAALAADPDGGSLDDTDRAVVAFASKVAVDAAAVTQDDVDALRAVGLSDNEIADVVFTVAARCFFTTVLDGLGVAADHQLAGAVDPEVALQLTVGRPFAAAPAP